MTFRLVLLQTTLNRSGPLVVDERVSWEKVVPSGTLV